MSGAIKNAMFGFRYGRSGHEVQAALRSADATQAALATRRRAGERAAARQRAYEALIEATQAEQQRALPPRANPGVRDLYPDLPNIGLLASDQF
jgi:hypothetical protein